MIKGIEKLKQWLRLQIDMEAHLVSMVKNDVERLRHEAKKNTLEEVLRKMREEGV